MDLSERGTDPAPRHPWESVRAEFFIDVLRRHGLLTGARRWLDVGAGDGWLTRELADASDAATTFVCWDIHYDEEIVSSLNRADAQDAGPDISYASEEPDEIFDSLLLLDVIEHVEDDLAFLSGLVRDRLRPGGSALVSVPAWQRLFSEHDVALSHYRRYSPGQAAAVLTKAGLIIEVEGGLFHGLLAPRTAQVVVERAGRRRPTTGIGAWRGGPRTTQALEAVLRADTHVSRFLSERGLLVPGLSYWALCRKP